MSKDNCFIFLDTAAHSLQFTDLAVSHVRQPGVQPFSLAMTEDVHEVLRLFRLLFFLLLWRSV